MIMGQELGEEEFMGSFSRYRSGEGKGGLKGAREGAGNPFSGGVSMPCRVERARERYIQRRKEELIIMTSLSPFTTPPSFAPP